MNTYKITFEEAIATAKDKIERMKTLEGKPWGSEGSMIELSKQVGDLSKLVMRYEGYYAGSSNQTEEQKKSIKNDIADELADLLYVIIRLSHHYQIDLLQAHLDARAKEEVFLQSKGK